MTSPKIPAFITQIQGSLLRMTGVENSLDLESYLVPTADKNALVVREQNGEAELAVCLQTKLLEEFAQHNFPSDFKMNLLPSLSVVVEELSHFNTYCERAQSDREISQLEMEVQGEVDKFAVSLEWLHLRNEQELKGQIFDCLFGNFETGEWVTTEEDRARYLHAHEIARNFCRSILEKDLPFSRMQNEFKEFFALTPSQKLSQKF